MKNSRQCNKYLDENSPGFVVEYRGNFKEEIDRVDYACGDIVTDSLAIVSLAYRDLDRLRKDVPSIIFIEFRSIYVLQDTSPYDVDNINTIKVNPYLNLTGRGVLVGIVDSGIDYLNEEFIREDGTSRIVEIWDQSLPKSETSTTYIGNIYSNEKINEAIKRKRANQDPYEIVPSKDEVGHGTKMASIIGSRGYNSKVKGVANDCEFAVVKLFPSPNYKKILRENGVKEVPTYNNTEVISAIEHLKNYSLKVKKPIVLFIGVGSTEGAHDGRNITSRYLTSIASNRGVVLVSGTGNEGNKEGHVTEYIENAGVIKTIELVIPREFKEFSFTIWVRRPNRMSLNIITPAGEESDFIAAKIDRVEEMSFILTNTDVRMKYYDPEQYTGNEAINIEFANIKPGIWKLQLRGDYIIDGRCDIWLQPSITLPEGVKFLKPNPYNTLTIPSTARRTVTVAYYNNMNNTLVSESGKGFNVNGIINPDITTGGINIISTSPGGEIVTSSGSSVATAIVAGTSALLLQWGIVDGHDTTMYSSKVRSYLIYGAEKRSGYSYPNEDLGYGFLDIFNTFQIIGGAYRGSEDRSLLEFYVDNIYISIDKKLYDRAIKKGDILSEG